MFDPCPDCPVADGACWPRRSGVKRVCEVPAYRPLIVRWGESGSPDADAAEEKSFTEATIDKVVSDTEFFRSLSAEEKARVSDCPKRKDLDGRGCCGASAPVCVGGSRDDQVVRTIDCARCVAAGLDRAQVS
jgi:hypothetical protein